MNGKYFLLLKTVPLWWAVLTLWQLEPCSFLFKKFEDDTFIRLEEYLNLLKTQKMEQIFAEKSGFLKILLWKQTFSHGFDTSFFKEWSKKQKIVQRTPKY